MGEPPEALPMRPELERAAGLNPGIRKKLREPETSDQRVLLEDAYQS